MNFHFFRKQKKPNEKHYQLLNELRELDRYKHHSYEGETKTEIETFRQRLYQVIDELIENNQEGKTQSEEKVDGIKQEAKLLKEKFAKAKLEAEEMQKKIENTIEKALVFVENTNFYPPEYVFDINKLKGHILDIEEDRKENPLQSHLEYEELRQQVEQNIYAFKELHTETVELISKIEKKTAQKEKKEQQEIVELKEKLFRHLQMGQLDAAKSCIKKIKKEVKKI